MPTGEVNRRLKAVHLAQWLPLLGVVLGSVAGFFAPNFFGGAFLASLFVGWLLATAFVLWNLIHALRTLAAGEFDPGILRAVQRHKLAMLPFFALSTVFSLVLLFSSIAMLNPWLFLLIPIVIPLGILGLCGNWVMMLSTSGYVIAQIVLLWRHKRLTLGQGLLHVMLQLLPVTDVLGCIHLSMMFAKPAPPGNPA